MALYPSLEDLKVGKIIEAQAAQNQAQFHSSYNPSVASEFPQHVPETHGTSLPYTLNPTGAACGPPPYSGLYPSLGDFMGLDLNSENVKANIGNAIAIPPSSHVAVPHATSGPAGLPATFSAPVTGNDIGLRRANVTHGIRELSLCKDDTGKVGLRVRAINNGVFVSLVHVNTPASLVGLRFGDQILQIDGKNMAGMDTNKAMDLIKKSSAKKIEFIVRDRPFERTVTLHKNSVGNIGFGFKNGKITQIVKDSSAARNGVLTDHHLLEINGQNVVGLKDKDVTKIIESTPQVVTITIMPSFLYEHMIKCMGSSLVTNLMDHSIPDV